MTLARYLKIFNTEPQQARAKCQIDLVRELNQQCEPPAVFTCMFESHHCLNQIQAVASK